MTPTLPACTAPTAAPRWSQTPGAAGIARRGWPRSAVRRASRWGSRGRPSATSAARRGSGGEEDDAAAQCPACQKRAPAHRHRLDPAPRVRGVRRHLGRRRRLRATVRATGVADGRPAASGARAAVKPAAPVRYRPCLRCGKMMNRVNFGQALGGGDRRLPRTRHISRRRRAASDRHVHPARRPRPRPAQAREEIREEEQRVRDLERKAARERRASGGAPLYGSAVGRLPGSPT